MHAEGRGQLRCQSLPSSLREGLLLNALLAGFKLWGIPEILFFFHISHHRNTENLDVCYYGWPLVGSGVLNPTELLPQPLLCQFTVHQVSLTLLYQTHPRTTFTAHQVSRVLYQTHPRAIAGCG